jgi:histidine phosphotransferase ChpT
MTFDLPPPRPDLAALIAQRLCHDLVNPLGAVSNGLELLAMTMAGTPEMALMRDSLDQALGRIKLYRLGFGAAAAGGTIGGDELAAALAAVGGSRPVRLEPDLPAELPRPDARLLVLMALCAETALAWGGRLEVRAAGGAGGPMSVVAEAARLRIDPEPWAALAEGRVPAEPTAPLVHFSLLPAAAAAAGRRLQVAQAEGRVVLSA